MSTYGLPGFSVESFEATLVPNTRRFESPFGGVGQVLDLLGERWRFIVGLSACMPAEGAAREAFFNRLRGGVHKVAVPHLRRPRPRGTLRGATVLGQSAAQGASSLVFAGVATPPNVLAGGGFEHDSNADGLADGWVAHNAGSAGALSFVISAGNGGGTAQSIASTSLGATVNDQMGLRYGSTVPTVPGQPWTFSVDVKDSGATVRLVAEWFDAGNAVISYSSAGHASSMSWVRRSLAATAPAGAAYARWFVWCDTGAGAAASMDIDNAQLEVGAATAYAGAATVLAGDLFGVAGQLFQAAADAAGDGRITVEMVNRTRVALAAAEVVTWDRPTVACICQPVPTGYTSVLTNSALVEFMESP